MAKTQFELEEYKYGFRSDDSSYVYKSEKGLSREIVDRISRRKKEPDWMREFRLNAYEIFKKKPMPTWGGDLSKLDFDDIYYYVRPTDRQGRSWDEVPPEIKETFDRLGIPEAEQKWLGGVSAQYESEVIYKSMREDLAKQGVIFTDMDTAVREYPELVRQYFGTVVPPADNKFAALNSAVWSGGSFVYVPEGVRVEIPPKPTSALIPRTWASSSVLSSSASRTASSTMLKGARRRSTPPTLSMRRSWRSS